MLDPQIWAGQVKNEYKANGNDSMPDYISKIKSNKRRYKIHSTGIQFFGQLEGEYDAYKEDIAMVEVFFEQERKNDNLERQKERKKERKKKERMII